MLSKSSSNFVSIIYCKLATVDSTIPYLVAVVGAKEVC